MKSVIHGRDNQVLREMLGFYSHPDGEIIDVTANKRRFWKGIDTTGVVFCDIDIAVGPDVVCDFKRLPFLDNSASVIIFDPPHLPAAAGSPKSMANFVESYGLRHTVPGDNISPVFRPFLLEAERILKDDGLVFAKLCDFVHNHRYQWSLVSFIDEVKRTSLTPCDLIIKIDPSAGYLRSGRWRNSYHARRSHCWWIVLRKGGCEPKIKRGVSKVETK